MRWVWTGHIWLLKSEVGLKWLEITFVSLWSCCCKNVIQTGLRIRFCASGFIGCKSAWGRLNVSTINAAQRGLSNLWKIQVGYQEKLPSIGCLPVNDAKRVSSCSDLGDMLVWLCGQIFSHYFFLPYETQTASDIIYLYFLNISCWKGVQLQPTVSACPLDNRNSLLLKLGNRKYYKEKTCISTNRILFCFVFHLKHME